MPSKLEKARAMQCFGKKAEQVELDPDPYTLDILTEEYNCANCKTYKYCDKLADTLSEV